MPLHKDKSDFQIATEKVKCPKCGAFPGKVCTLMSGRRRGDNADSCHNERLRAAGFGSERPNPWRYFTIPGGTFVPWDEDVHGKEVSVEACGSGDCTVEISWRPGEYYFSSGSGGEGFTFLVPETQNTPQPRQEILKGIHHFLKVAYDERT